MAKDDNPNSKQIADNRRARYDYAIEEDVECGIVLEGSEVKSLRQGGTQIAEAYAAVEDGELWLVNSYIAPYGQAKTFGHEEKRRRKLLVKAARAGPVVERHAAPGHDAGALVDVFQRPRHGEDPHRHRQGQEDPRQAPHRGQARLAASEGPAPAARGVRPQGAPVFEPRPPRPGAAVSP